MFCGAIVSKRGCSSSFVSLDSVSKSYDARLHVSAPREKPFNCAKDRVSVLFWSAAQYIKVDTSTEKLTRWRVALPLGVGPRANGFAVTQDGRSFIGLGDFSAQDKMWKSGLYELNINAGTSVATLIPVAGTITKRDSDEIAPDALSWISGGRTQINWWCKGKGDGWDLSWARVSACVTTAD